MKTIINEVKSSLQLFADQKRIAFSIRNFPSKMEFIGVSNPHAKTVMKELKSLTKNESDAYKIDLCKRLTNTNIFECQFVAFEYISCQKKLIEKLSMQDIDELSINMDNWVSVDTFSVGILGPAWRIGIVPTEYIYHLYKSNDHWKRRMAIVATVGLNLKSRGGTGDPKKTIEICELAVKDSHEMVIKALSWALRELSKSDAEVVREFLHEHEKQLHKRIIREVNHKLETGLKN